MSNTTFSGPVRAGTNRDANSPVPANVGTVILAQSIDVTATAATNYDNLIYIPGTATIVDIIFDTRTAFTTSGVVLIGSTAFGGQEYVASVSIASQGRTRAAPTTQLNLWHTPTSDANGNEALYVRVTAGGTAGRVAITVLYRQ